jgi:hypothetical protein
VNSRMFLIVGLIAVCGCTPRSPSALEEGFVLHQPRGYVLTVLLDLSGSFSDRMVDDGKAWEFLLTVIDEYFKNRVGENDEIIVAQISGNRGRALLWKGTPSQLRSDFSSPEAFGEFIRSKADPNQSNVYDNIAQSVEYLSSDQDVSSGKAKSAVLILSDLLDNDPNRDATWQRLQKSLAHYGSQGGVVGCYFVDQQLVPEWNDLLARTGIRTFVVEPDIAGNPQLPGID